MRSSRKKFLGIAILTSIAVSAFAHDEAPSSWREAATAWEFDPFVVAGLLLSGWLYWRGVGRLWRTMGRGKGIKKSEVLCFAAGWFATAMALVSPLHPLGEALFSAHMVQHEILMAISAPLLVAGRPLIAFLKVLPGAWAGALARCGNSATWQTLWRALASPLAAWLIHAAALWVWHIPWLFQAAVENDFTHSLQHVSFLFSALLFWWALLHGRARMRGYGMAVLYIFTTALHTGALGAIITIANHPVYPVYETTTRAFGLTPLEDQQLGGLIMWVPAGLVYVAVALALFAAWLRESEARVKTYEMEWPGRSRLRET
jgi:putative membrane protein